MTRVIVVGGGVIGTMIAFLATRRGCQVVQLERELAARGASVRNFGLIWISGRRVGEELELALRSRALWQEIALQCPEAGFRANGSLTIAQRPDELRVLEQVCARSDAAERSLELLGPEDVRAVNPAIGGDVLAGLYCKGDAAVEPRRVPEALRGAMGAAYRWLPGRHVVELFDRAVRDHTGDRHQGDVVFVCPGAAHRGLAGWDGEVAPLRRVRLQMLETEPFPFELTTSIADGDSLRYYPAFDVPARAGLHEPPAIVAEHKIQLLLQQRLDGSLTIGDTHAYDEPFDNAVADAPYEHLRGRVESILGTTMPKVRRRWAGVYSEATGDRLFYSEQVAESVWVINGAGGRGMTMSAAIAERALDEAGLTDTQRTTASSTGL